jgi:hypothetical protein
MFNQFYRDDLDYSRLLMPIKDSKVNKGCFVCKVFFEDERSGKRDYVGTAEAPKSLFSATDNQFNGNNSRSRYYQPKEIYFTLVQERDASERGGEGR